MDDSIWGRACQFWGMVKSIPAPSLRQAQGKLFTKGREFGAVAQASRLCKTPRLRFRLDYVVKWQAIWLSGGYGENKELAAVDR